MSPNVYKRALIVIRLTEKLLAVKFLTQNHVVAMKHDETRRKKKSSWVQHEREKFLWILQWNQWSKIIFRLSTWHCVRMIAGKFQENYINAHQTHPPKNKKRIKERKEETFITVKRRNIIKCSCMSLPQYHAHSRNQAQYERCSNVNGKWLLMISSEAIKVNFKVDLLQFWWISLIQFYKKRIKKVIWYKFLRKYVFNRSTKTWQEDEDCNDEVK